MRLLSVSIGLSAAAALLACAPKPYPATYTRSEGGGAVTVRLDEGSRAALVLRAPGAPAPQTAEGTYTVVGDSVFVVVRNFGMPLNAKGRFEGGGLTLSLPGAQPATFTRD